MIPDMTSLVITRITLAMYVPSGTGRAVHQNRTAHGFVFNDESTVRDYIFSDGTVLRTEPLELFYLPKGSTYYTKTIIPGGCYAINFDAVFEAPPFSIRFRNAEPLVKPFKTAAREWRSQTACRQPIAMRSLYDIIYLLHCEQQKKYLPDARLHQIAPAVDKITADFTENSLSVAELASLCGISEAYFRRIFLDRFGVSPKEYIIAKRIDYARQLLESGQFSVAQTAVLCGYEEACHFSREFTKRVGVTPHEYKNLHV